MASRAANKFSGLCLRNTRFQRTLLSQFSLRNESSVKSNKSEDNKIVPQKKENWLPVEKQTHTGQKWDDDDYRLVRFIDKEKQINERFAIDLIAEVKPIACKSRVVHCDGGDGPLGHPRVFINLDQPGNHSCGYCGLRFYLEHDAHH